MYFEQLPQNYQVAINKAIHEWGKQHDPTLNDSFREWKARTLLETYAVLKSQMLESDTFDELAFVFEYIAFIAGWGAKDKIQMKLEI